MDPSIKTARLPLLAVSVRLYRAKRVDRLLKIVNIRTVFLSSTTKDLAECREEAYKAIQDLDGWKCVQMENFGARDARPEEFCQSKVAECDLFICIAGPVYGSRTPTGKKSFTEMEYDTAVKMLKPCLVFIATDEFSYKGKLRESDNDRRRQKSFRKRLCKDRIVDSFSAYHEVRIMVSKAIRNWELDYPPSSSQSNLLSSQITPVCYRVAVFNKSGAATDDQVKAAIAALQTQVHRDFAPVWGINAQLSFVPRDSDPQPGSWWLQVLDDSDTEGFISYHTLNEDGLPLVRVFVRTALQASLPWTLSASHELLEMLANPGLNLTALRQNGGESGWLYKKNICDPCMAPEWGYEIEDTLVSDFVFPAWFETFQKSAKTQFDYGRHIAEPFTSARGGYVQVLACSAGWQSFFFPSMPSQRLGKRVLQRNKGRSSSR